MESMRLIKSSCQEVPNRKWGLVVGLDISKENITFRACRPDEASKLTIITQDMKGFNKLLGVLEAYKNDGYEMWVGYEPTGPYSCCVLEYLVEKNWKVVQVNPKHTSKFNDIRDNIPGKEDSRDPRAIADLIWQGCYRTPLHLTGTYAELRAATAEWEMLKRESTVIKNQLHSLMELWFPELRMIFKTGLCKSTLAIMKKYTTSESLAKAGFTRVRDVLHKASCGRTASRARELVDAASNSTALKSGQKSRHRTMMNHLARLELIETHKSALYLELEKLLLELPESKSLLSVNGVGIITTALLLGECGNIGDYSVGQLEKLVGLNLCHFSSGKHKGKKKISKCGRSSVRYALCMAATQMMRKNGIYFDVVEIMRQKEKKPGMIRIAVARKLLKLLHALVCSGESFALQRFVARRGTGDDLLVLKDRQPSTAA
jgi:transposase